MPDAELLAQAVIAALVDVDVVIAHRLLALDEGERARVEAHCVAAVVREAGRG